MTEQVNPETHHHRPEGPKRHIVTFLISILLTGFAFMAVIIGGNATWVVPFIIGIAVVQVLFQLYVWMHMDQRGHGFPAVAIYMGTVFVVAFIVTFVYWLGGW